MNGRVQAALASLCHDHAATPSTTKSKKNAVGQLQRQCWKAGVKDAIPEKPDYEDPAIPQRDSAEENWS